MSRCHTSVLPCLIVSMFQVAPVISKVTPQSVEPQQSDCCTLNTVFPPKKQQNFEMFTIFHPQQTTIRLTKSPESEPDAFRLLAVPRRKKKPTGSTTLNRDVRGVQTAAFSWLVVLFALSFTKSNQVFQNIQTEHR